MKNMHLKLSTIIFNNDRNTEVKEYNTAIDLNSRINYMELIAILSSTILPTFPKQQSPNLIFTSHEFVNKMTQKLFE